MWLKAGEVWRKKINWYYNCCCYYYIVIVIIIIIIIIIIIKEHLFSTILLEIACFS